jgi:hypothetical protein
MAQMADRTLLDVKCSDLVGASGADGSRRGGTIFLGKMYVGGGARFSQIESPGGGTQITAKEMQDAIYFLLSYCRRMRLGWTRIRSISRLI